MQLRKCILLAGSYEALFSKRASLIPVKKDPHAKGRYPKLIKGINLEH